jgi:transcriptional regulator with AAA-type ATPase domain
MICGSNSHFVCIAAADMIYVRESLKDRINMANHFLKSTDRKRKLSLYLSRILNFAMFTNLTYKNNKKNIRKLKKKFIPIIASLSKSNRLFTNKNIKYGVCL